MRPAAALAISFALAAPPAMAQESNALAAPIERCIRDNAAKVEAAVEDLSRAATFLISNICAEPVAAENARQQRLSAQRRSKQWQDACDAQKKEPSSSQENKQTFDFCGSSARIAFTGVTAMTGEDDDGPYFGGAGSPAATALASKLLLDLRLSHSKTGQQR